MNFKVFYLWADYKFDNISPDPIIFNIFLYTLLDLISCGQLYAILSCTWLKIIGDHHMLRLPYVTKEKTEVFVDPMK